MDFSEDDVSPITDHFALAEADLPTYVIFDSDSERDFIKYKLGKSANSENFMTFIEEFKNKKLKRFVNSEDILTNNTKISMELLRL